MYTASRARNCGFWPFIFTLPIIRIMDYDIFVITVANPLLDYASFCHIIFKLRAVLYIKEKSKEEG